MSKSQKKEMKKFSMKLGKPDDDFSKNEIPAGSEHLLDTSLGESLGTDSDTSPESDLEDKSTPVIQRKTPSKARKPILCLLFF